ncbi:MAG: hypothetical protein U1F36_08145 [Planctomycetota bacterium]
MIPFARLPQDDHGGLIDWYERLWRALEAHGGAVLWLAIASLVMLVASLALVRYLVVRMPADYFCRHGRPVPRRHPVVHVLAVVARNLIGIVLLVLGIVMLIGPGQGLLTILLAIGLIDFPGKARVELALVRRKPIRHAIDWCRHRAGKPSIVLPGDPPTPPLTSA